MPYLTKRELSLVGNYLTKLPFFVNFLGLFSLTDRRNRMNNTDSQIDDINKCESTVQEYRTTKPW
tara:strand:+ start:520 stop:714 length:195 start_codon:yes stop_codon:yes gene_type:complete